MGKPQGTLNPVKESNKFDLGPNMDLDVPQGLKKAQVACSYGCNQHATRYFWMCLTRLTRRKKSTKWRNVSLPGRLK